MVSRRISASEEQIAEFCRRHHIVRLAFFGSVLRDDFGPDSDIDVLVEFHPEHIPGWEIVDIEEEFSRLCGGRKVEFVNPKYLHPRLRQPVLAQDRGDAASSRPRLPARGPGHPLDGGQ
jgi:predicted nucleotidyltransferase